jgi:hypothetical protein
VYIGKTPTVGNFQVCDAISVVNGQAAYTLQVGGVNVAPESANHMLVSLNGILQKPGSSFTISGSTMTFASNLATGDVIDFVQILGNVLDIGQPSDDTVTAAKLNNDIISGQTALTSSPADTDELLISDAGTIKRIDVSLVGGKNTPAFYAELSSGQTTSDSSATKIQFNTEVFDSGSVYDNSTNYRFTPGVAGKYFIFSGLSVYGSNAFTIGQSFYYIYKNGSAYASEQHYEIDGSSNTNGSASFHIGRVLDLDDDDYIEMYLNADVSSGSPSVQGGTGTGNSTYFGAYRLIT